eukprot:2485677-Rhodomonas_salina.2
MRVSHKPRISFGFTKHHADIEERERSTASGDSMTTTSAAKHICSPQRLHLRIRPKGGISDQTRNCLPFLPAPRLNLSWVPCTDDARFRPASPRKGPFVTVTCKNPCGADAASAWPRWSGPAAWVSNAACVDSAQKRQAAWCLFAASVCEG